MKSSVLITVLFHCVTFVKGDTVQYWQIDRNEKEGGNVAFKNCGERSNPIQLISLKINPQPIILGKGVHFLFTSAVINVTKPIGVDEQHITGDVSIKSKVGTTYIELCPLLKWGTCHMNDFCQWLNHDTIKMMCRYAAIPGFGCSCPILPRTYVIENLMLPVKFVDLVFHGACELLVALKDDVSVLGCVDMKLCVNSC